MYSRSRLPPVQERYAGSIPPMYSGNRFRNVRWEKAEPPEGERTAPAVEVPVPEKCETTPAPDEPKERISSEAAVSACAVPHSNGETLLAGLNIRKEEWILLAVLLLLCAEHEHAMDVIVILLLLLGIR